MENYSSIEKLYSLFIESNQLVCTDTRKLVKGSLFFCLKGDNFNANRFSEKAIEGGCAYAIVDEKEYVLNPKILLVENVLLTLQALANHHRKQFTIPMLAITGSNGKTTHKELIHAVLSKKYNTLATEGNLNNHIGVPLTLLKINKEHEFAIIEMGANHQGEINDLCQIAEPTFGLITNIGKAHLEGFGGIEGVKIGKSELYKFIKKTNGKVFINGDDEVLYDLALENDKISYGCKKMYDVIGKDLTSSETVSFKYTTRYGSMDWNKAEVIKTQIIGNYNFINCLAACSVGTHFKIEFPEVKEALESYVFENNRSQLIRTEKNTLILDAYNANPNSMKVAIENIAKSNVDNKLVLLGDMFELGEYSEAEHQKIIELLKENKIEQAVLVGENFYKIEVAPFIKCKTIDECKKYLIIEDLNNHTVLIKGSRGMKMEQLQEVL